MQANLNETDETTLNVQPIRSSHARAPGGVFVVLATEPRVGAFRDSGEDRQPTRGWRK